jgi:hypothetical protein
MEWLLVVGFTTEVSLKFDFPLTRFGYQSDPLGDQVQRMALRLSNNIPIASNSVWCN